jgi:diacylglycerol kinase (ATP)
MPQRVLLFANPIAGKGRGMGIGRRIEAALRNAGYEVLSFFEQASLIREERLRCDPPAVAAISIGGDGTLRAVAERLLSCFADSEIPPIIVVSLGTANLMSSHLGMDWNVRDWHGGLPARLVDVLKARNIRRLDTARCKGELLLLMTGIGIDGMIIHEMARVRKGPITIPSYLLPTAMALGTYTYPAITVKADGRTVFGPAPGMAFIGNAREYGIGFPILSKARSDDGLLDVCVLPCASRADALKLAMQVVVGEHLQSEGVVYLNAKHVHVTSASPVPVQVDGEAMGTTPAEIDLLPQKLPFIVP